MKAILIAETDRYTLDVLQPLLFDHISGITIESCTSLDGLSRKLKDTTYDTVAMSSRLVSHYRVLTHRNPAQAIAPLLVTASQLDRTLAYRAIKKRDAFDLIIKPIASQEVIQTVTAALWQNKLLKLLASRERVSARFREHMEAFPNAQQAKEQFAEKLETYDRAYQTLKASKRLLLDVEDENSLFDMAASMERLTRKGAIDRLVTRFPEYPIE